MNPIAGALKDLLDELDFIAESHEEIGDTEVRYRLRDCVSRGFLSPEPGFDVPSDLGLYTEEANARARLALRRFLSSANAIARSANLMTASQRLAAFQDGGVESNHRTYYDDYFGYSKESSDT